MLHHIKLKLRIRFRLHIGRGGGNTGLCDVTGYLFAKNMMQSNDILINPIYRFPAIRMRHAAKVKKTEIPTPHFCLKIPDLKT
jgi:hypothetical protein